MPATLQQLQDKYRSMRERLVKNFVAVGPSAGMSLPYNIHTNSLYWTIGDPDSRSGDNYYEDAKYDCRSQHPYTNDPYRTASRQCFRLKIGCTEGFVMQFGDTTVNLGFYMALLATEYGLLEMQNDPNTAYRNQLKDEIYYALNAIVRLDKEAHRVLGFTSNGYSGYFLRDDADVGLYQSAPKTGPQGSGMLNEDLGGVTSDYIRPAHNTSADRWKKYICSTSVFAS